MAKGLKKIIRFHQSLIDEKRKVLGDFLNQASICDKQRQDFKANIIAEQDNVSNTTNMVAMFYGGYVASTYQKIKEIGDPSRTYLYMPPEICPTEIDQSIQH